MRKVVENKGELSIVCAGIVHAITGNCARAKSAIKSANRSTGVVSGGAIGEAETVEWSTVEVTQASSLAVLLAQSLAASSVEQQPMCCIRAFRPPDIERSGDSYEFCSFEKKRHEMRWQHGRPSGSFAAVSAVVKAPCGGAVFDAVAVPIFDGLAGFSAGQLAAQVHAGLLTIISFHSMEKLFT